MSKPKHSGPDERKIAVDAYAPPDERQRSDHIVDVVCRIMEDDGPRPMRDSRPAQKSRNAADQFDAEHQEAYEARVARSRDRVRAVHAHNAAYPKMHDELNKKRSTARVTMMNAQRNDAYQQVAYNRCNACMKQKKKVQPRRKITGRHTKDSKKKTTQKQGGARITKPKARQPARQSPCRIYRLSKLKTNKCCQCPAFPLVRDKKSGTNAILLNLEPQAQKMAQGTFTCRDLQSGYSECKEPSKTSQCTKESSNNPDRDNPDTDPSVSSYNSYPSMEDEPMVSH